MQFFRISLRFVFLLTALMACGEGSVEQPTTQDKTAPEETPRVYGSAKGFSRMPW